jgi:signal transduction histidine kinase
MSRRIRLAGFGRSRLRWLLGLFFLALAVPTAVLVRQAYLQLKWESFHQHRAMAEELSARIDARLARLIEAEEARSFSDYAFLVVAGDPQANFLQRSPLSEFPPKSNLPGVLGWFQLDAEGMFSTPLLPAQTAGTYGIPEPELAQRAALQSRLWEILSRNRLVQTRKEDAARQLKVREESVPPAAAPTGKDAAKPAAPVMAAPPSASPPGVGMEKAEAPAQAAFDELSQAVPERKKKQEAASTLGKVEDLKLGSRYQMEADKEAPRVYPGKSAVLEKRAGRKERSALPESPAPVAGAAWNAALPAPAPLRVATFESEIDPLEFACLDSGDFVLFRKVWRDGQRYIQGLPIESAPFLRGLIEAEFRATALSRMSQLAVAHRGEVLAAYSGAAEREYLRSAREMQGDLLYRTRLSAPLDGLELIFTITRLPAGPGGTVVGWLAAILGVVLCGGFYLMYRLGLRQIELARQQQDFISAVSHELKTPLTSIRMYGEMLRAGWVEEDRKAAYYDFIYSESERLSRLIANVLQLARLSRNGLELAPRTLAVSELLDNVRSKLGAQVEQAGFELRFVADPDAAEALIRVDADAFAQIAINLVDNALKFSARSPRKAVDIGFHRQRDGTVVFSVRDFGPGVPKNQMKKIFQLFYRLENELTRETVGTGIGLALVHQLALAMGARVDVVNLEPGAEFRVVFREVAGKGSLL